MDTSLTEQQIRQIVQNEITQDQTQASYGVSLIPFHKHTGVDAPKIDVVNLSIFSTDGTLANNSDSEIPSQKAVKTYGIVGVAAQTYTPSGGGTATLDLSLSNEHRITMPAGNITIALSNDSGSQKFIVGITQDGGGSRTVTWFSTIRWTNGVTPTLTTTGNKRDVFGFIRTGSGTYDGFTVGQNL